MAKVIRIDNQTKVYKKRASFLYFFLFTLFIVGAITLFHQKFTLFFIELFSFLLMFAGVKLIDKGLEFEIKYQKSSFVKLSFFQKYKLFGSILFATSLAIIEFFINSHQIFQTIITFILAISGVLLFYGLDPSKDKLPQNIANLDKFLSTIQEAKTKIEAIKKSQEKIQNYALKEKINQAANKAQEIVKSKPKIP